MIKEIILKEVIKQIFSIVASKVKNLNYKIDTSNEETLNAINEHLTLVKNWSNEITFKDLRYSKETSKVYIPLNLFVYPIRIKIVREEKIPIISILEIFKKEKNHIVILGQPGAGKTTSMKYLCQSIFFNEEFYPTEFKIPILVKLRDFNNRSQSKNNTGLIIEYLFNLFRLRINIDDLKEKPNQEYINRLKESIVLEIIEKNKILLIIDGFDELVYGTHRDTVINEITDLANYLESSRLILTSRTADYEYSLENISVFEISPLNNGQILDFAEKWLGNEEAKKFLNEVKNSPYQDTSIRPITIAHLCAIYERIGKIPEKPKTVYRKIVNLLIDEWDEQRKVKRTSKYAMFEADRKFEFLSDLAYHLTIRSGRAIFSKLTFLKVFDDIYINYDLEKENANELVKDIESHTGLFIKSGYEQFEFAHKSIQEYLTAEYIVRLPKIPTNKRLIQRIPNELAIAITISSNPSAYFVELVDNVFTEIDFNFSFAQRFVSRLILEKPDFYQNFNVGLSALKVYSSLINENENNQPRLFYSDILINEFESLINEVFKRNTNKNVMEMYDVVDKHLSIDQTYILTLNRKLEISKSLLTKNNIMMNEIPKKLFCRESFIK